MRSAWRVDSHRTTQSALAVSPEEREASFEERWRGETRFVRAYPDILTDERANAMAGEFVRGEIKRKIGNAETARRSSPTQPVAGYKRLCVDRGGYSRDLQPTARAARRCERAGPIERITPRGLIAGGREHVLNTLVCSPPASTR